MSMFSLSLVLSVEPTDFSAASLTGAAGIERVAEWGYDGVELAVRDPASVDADALEAAVADAGLRVPALGTGQAYLRDGLSLTAAEPGVRAAALQRLEAHALLATRLDAILIVGLIRGGPKASDWDRLVGALREVASFGPRVAVEAINRYETGLVNTCADGLRLVDAVGSDRLGLLLDTFHMNIEERSTQNAIDAAGERLFHFHVADSNRHYPGDGHVDFGATLAALERAGYGGFVSGEFMPHPDAETAAERAIAHLRSLEVRT
jgi:5-keto-L-gluconate epimerase